MPKSKPNKIKKGRRTWSPFSPFFSKEEYQKKHDEVRDHSLKQLVEGSKEDWFYYVRGFDDLD